jgi:cytochrome b subunit of formate dehydrogenase
MFSPAVVGWAVVLHFASVGVVVSGLMVHVYMGAHFKWWRDVRLAEHEWAKTHEGTAPEGEGSGRPEPKAAPPAV